MSVLAAPLLLEAAGYVLVAAALIQAGLGTWTLWQRSVAEQRAAAAAAEHFARRADLILRRAEVQRDRTVLSWNGWRKFVVARKIPECEGTHSFDLVPHDGRPIAPFLPGQYLTFQIRRPGDDRPLVRCYSLSDGPYRPDVYRVTIKTVPPPPGSDVPPGRSSSWFNQVVEPGDILDVRAPSGQFGLDPHQETGVVMIAGGIGVTPMISMVNTLSATGTPRSTWLFYGVHNRSQHAFAEHLAELRRTVPWITIVTFYSRPTPSCVAGRDYDHVGLITLDRLKATLPSNTFEFFVCGPPPMMEAMTRDLRAWGVPEERIHFEAFGPATVRRQGGGETGAPAAVGGGHEVVFSRSGKTVHWPDRCTSLLELAESNGIAIDSGCRAGNCGTCAVAIKEGTIDYLTAPGEPPATGTCLTCIATPASRLVLDT